MSSTRWSFCRQRLYGLALGYEDVIDHDELRSDALLAAVVGKTDPAGSRSRQRDRGQPWPARAP